MDYTSSLRNTRQLLKRISLYVLIRNDVHDILLIKNSTIQNSMNTIISYFLNLYMSLF